MIPWHVVGKGKVKIWRELRANPSMVGSKGALGCEPSKTLGGKLKQRRKVSMEMEKLHKRKSGDKKKSLKLKPNHSLNPNLLGLVKYYFDI